MICKSQWIKASVLVQVACTIYVVIIITSAVRVPTDSSKPEEKTSGNFHLDEVHPEDHRDHVHHGHHGHVIDSIDRRDAIRKHHEALVAAGSRSPSADIELADRLLETCKISGYLATLHIQICTAAALNVVTNDDTLREYAGMRNATFPDFATSIHLGKGFGGLIKMQGDVVKRIAPVERLWRECSWDSIAAVHRVHWERLGWSSALWEREETTSTISDKAFEDLTLLQQVSIWCLGYSRQTW